MGKHSLKWTRAQPIYKADNIMSSKAREKGDLTGFLPKYENDPKINMNFIMTDEYMRLWFKERDFYKKENYIKQQNSERDSNIRRRFVQRMNRDNKRPKKNLPIIELRKFQNIEPKVDDKRKPEDVKICPKYLTSLEDRKVEDRYKPDCEPTTANAGKSPGKSTEKRGNKSPKGKKSPNSTARSAKSDDNSKHMSLLDYCKMAC